MKTIADIAAFSVLFWASLMKLLPMMSAVAPTSDSYIVITDDTPVQAAEEDHAVVPPAIPVYPPPLQLAPIPVVSPEVQELRDRVHELETKNNQLQNEETLYEQEAGEYKHKLEDTLQQLKDTAAPTQPSPPPPAKVTPSHHHATSLNPAVQESQQTGKRVFALVTGPGCPKCKVIEDKVLPTTEFQEAMERFAFTVIDADEHPRDAEALYGPGTQTFPHVFSYVVGHPETRVDFEPKRDLSGFLAQIKSYSLN